MHESLAIVIRRTAWSDTSWIVTWLTREHGKISTMAKGARRPASPFSGKLDLFFTAEISYSEAKSSTLHHLREVRLVEPFDASGVPCANVFLAGYFAELADLITQPGEPVEKIYDLLSRGLGYLRRQPAGVRALTHFETELCLATGVGGESPLTSIASYCGRIPASREAALKLLS